MNTLKEDAYKRRLAYEAAIAQRDHYRAELQEVERERERARVEARTFEDVARHHKQKAERYREALRQISRNRPRKDDIGWSSEMMGSVARAALKGERENA